MINKIDAFSFTRRNFLKGLGVTAASLLIPKNLILTAQDQKQDTANLVKIAGELKPYIESMELEPLENSLSALSAATKELSDYIFGESEDISLEDILKDIETEQNRIWDDVFQQFEDTEYFQALDSVFEKIIYDSAFSSLFKEHAGPILKNAGFLEDDLKAFANPKDFKGGIDLVLSQGVGSVIETAVFEFNWAEEIRAKLEEEGMYSFAAGGDLSMSGAGLLLAGKGFWTRVGGALKIIGGGLVIVGGGLAIAAPEPATTAAGLVAVGTGTYLIGDGVKDLLGKKK